MIRMAIALLPALVACRGAAPRIEFSVRESLTDADGVVHYRIDSEAQSGPVELRLLLPSKLPPGGERRFLYVLPVEPDGQTRWGDGLAEVRKLGLHEKHGLVVVAPGFARLPWYADHPTDARRRDETFLLHGVLPFVESLHPSAKPRRLLLGFSKSGWGAFSLILRHPDLFHAAAAWDAPLMKDRPDQFEMGPAFGTQGTFEGYRLSRLLLEKAETFRASKRLAHFGYGNFRDHHVRMQALLGELGIPADYRDGPRRDHAWGSGWIPEAAEALSELSASQ